MYVAYYGRPGDPVGVAFWANQLDAVGGNLDAIIDSFGNSQEYRDRYGATSEAALIDAFYQQTFNRSADAAGLQFYLGELTSGRMTLASIAKNIWDGASGDDALTVANKLQASKQFTNHVAQEGLIYAADAIDAAVAALALVDSSPQSLQAGETALDELSERLGGDDLPPSAELELTALEQYQLELINRTRASPAEEAERLGIALNEGLAPDTLSGAPRQPLAFDPALTRAAREHSQWMLDVDRFGHTGEGGSSIGDRIEAAGYDDWWTYAENLAWKGSTLDYGDLAAWVLDLHEALFIDEGIDGRGHRINYLNPDLREAGLGILTGEFNGYNAMMLSNDYAASRSGLDFLTGVIYEDRDGDGFYTPGEGLEDVSIRAIGQQGAYQDLSMAAGGYQLQLPAGVYEVEFSTPEGMFMEIEITLAGLNEKVDWVL
ncbi:MAG: DUF4214 domain-containing protein [Gammaproteobacteria bacterium]|jgi:uncharacterized protein YkwD|nr:DUF4214 domain-containing protein [Gammaproteobacteria bacterium]